jgi:hypothetical protein
MYNLEPLILNGMNRTAARHYLSEVEFFDTGIMHYHDEALRVWRSVIHRYANKETELEIPFSLAETPKLYALDALCIASPLIKAQQQLFTIAELFAVFYLMTHFFDDHVEHPDKFFSKFDFVNDSSLHAQYGAAPFSFLLISFAVIKEILDSATDLNDSSRLAIQGAMYERLAVQTRHFAAERTSNLSVEEVLEMKARRVNGQALGVIADILREYLHLNETEFKRMESGMLYLGSLEQFTDDIRDFAIDSALHNANIIVSASRFGSEAGAKKITKMYQDEAELAKKYLSVFYNYPALKEIFSLPFYPFMVDKRELSEGKRGAA